MSDSFEPVPVPIEDRLDLHPFAPRDIADVVAEYLEEAWARGFDEVRLIHGRGIGVQRAVVQRQSADPVVPAQPPAPAQPLPPASDTPPTTEWKVEDLLPELDKPGRTRDLANGQKLFSEFACIQCHKLGDSGYNYGPNLTDLLQRWQGDRGGGAELLARGVCVRPPVESAVPADSAVGGGR